jgi:biopolymer transport protein ExbB
MRRKMTKGMTKGSSASRRSGAGVLALLLVLPLLALFVGATPARAWWNGEWLLRKKITIDTSAAGAGVSDPIGTSPVLLRLHVGNFRFEQAKEDGGDLRFVAADDKTPLKHHFEKYDSLLGEALVWVSIPDLKPGAKTEFYLYYANPKAVANADPKGSYDSDTVLVYHFAERGTPPQDSSVWGNHAQSAGQTTDGALIGGGLRLDGRTPLILPGSTSLAFTDNTPLTWSAWINMAAPQPGAIIYSRHDAANALVIGLDNGAPFVEVTGAAGVARSAAGAPVAANGWHHLAVVADGSQLTVYVDGAVYASLAGGIPALTGTALLGGDIQSSAPSPTPPSAAPAAGEAPAAPAAPTAPEAAAAISAVAAAAGFTGDMDELEIAKVARPAGFIKAAAIGQGTNPGTYIAYGVDEETSSWLSGYFVVILRAVTIDGWVVIGILMMMAVVSWFVMVRKASYLSRQAKGNASFMKYFRELTADLTSLDRGDGETKQGGGKLSAADRRMMRDSSLYRIYRVGATQIRRRFAGSMRAKGLSVQSIAAIRAGLDAAYVQETQRLNRLMVILTIAISGGPFLGLLGTVVGVMITFAAIAATGDVNINAIAPGISAALVATVAGLAVAIPALFGYNYLITNIKNLTSDMQVFIDEFVARMAESYQPQPEELQQMAAE